MEERTDSPLLGRGPPRSCETVRHPILYGTVCDCVGPYTPARRVGGLLAFVEGTIALRDLCGDTLSRCRTGLISRFQYRASCRFLQQFAGLLAKHRLPPRFLRKPCCSSSMKDSENCCIRLATMREINLTPIERRVTPLQLLLLLLGCFCFQRGITVASIQESGQCAVAVSGGALHVVSQSCWVNVKRLSMTCWGAHLIISTLRHLRARCRFSFWRARASVHVS